MNSYVYIITHKGAFKNTPNKHRLIKVGKANDIGQRIQQAKTWFPYGIKLLKSYTFPSDKVAESREKYIHFRFNGYRTQGEWFSVPMHIYFEIDRILRDKPELTFWQKLRLKFKI